MGLRLVLAGFALAQAITFAVHLKDVHVVGQAVQQRTGQSLRTEGFGPFIESQAADDQRRAAFIALRDQLEQQFGASFAEWYEAQLVNDQQLVAEARRSYLPGSE